MNRWKILILLILSTISSLYSKAQGGPYNNSPIVVNSTNDYNPFGSPIVGTLRWAITKANNNTTNPGADKIIFDLPTNNLIIQINALYGNLPRISDELFIDGTSQPGYIRLDESTMVKIIGTGGQLDGCFIYQANSNDLSYSKVEGLYLYGFGGVGIGLLRFNSSTPANNINIIDNIINRLTPYASLPPLTVVNSNAIFFMLGNNHLIQGNIFGTDLSKRLDYALQQPIFFLSSRGDILNAKIGGTSSNEKNTIVYSGHGIVMIKGSYLCETNLITQNEIISTLPGPYSPGNLGIFITVSSLNPANIGKSKPVITSLTATGIATGTADNNDLVEIFGSTGEENANEYLTTVTAVGGNWTANLGQLAWPYITATATDLQNNTSQLSIAVPTIPCPTDIDFGFSGLCLGSPTDFNIITTEDLTGATITWDFNDGSPSASGVSPSHQYTSAGTYTVTLDILFPNGCTFNLSHTLTIEVCCEQCIGSFAPIPGERYVLSAWVKEDTPNQVETYVGPEIELDFGFGQIAGPYTAKGNIIEGWQKIEEVFTIPNGAYKIEVFLNNTGNNDVYFDDIRINPFNSSMKSYVYDPVSLRLWAELDDRNYATFYQYDEEGKLIRIKKETARGVETIQESREGSYKKEKVFDEKLNLNDSSN